MKTSHRPKFQFYMRDLFARAPDLHGEVARLKIADIERCVSCEMFLTEVRRRGFAAVQASGRLVILGPEGLLRQLS